MNPGHPGSARTHHYLTRIGEPVEYNLNHFTIADARALVGTTCDITQWDDNDDDMGTKITYPAAKVIGVLDRTGPCLCITTAGAVITDAATGQQLGTLRAEDDWCVALRWVCEVTRTRDQQDKP